MNTRHSLLVGLSLLASSSPALVLIDLPADRFPSGHTLFEAAVFLLPDDLPYTLPPTAIMGPDGDPALYHVVFNYDLPGFDNCGAYRLFILTDSCSRLWRYLPFPPPPDCDAPVTAQITPLERCECWPLDLLCQRPLQAVTDLHLEASESELWLTWTPPTADIWGHGPVEVDHYEVHASASPWFTPEPATLAAVTTEPTCTLPLPADAARNSFRVVAFGERVAPPAPRQDEASPQEEAEE